MTVSTKVLLNAKLQNSVSWNISNLSPCGNSLALIMSSKSEVFWNIKISKKCKS